MSTQSQINQVKPKLSTVAPLTAFLCWVYAIANILMGIGMALLYTTTVPIAVANIFTYGQWGVIFIILGITGAVSMLRNNWALTRNVQVVSLMVKATWGVALLFRVFVAPASILITLVWLTLAMIQAGLYVHFLPLNMTKDGHYVG